MAHDIRIDVYKRQVMEAAFADKKVFDENINNNVFNTIYVNDIFDEARETYAQNAGKYIYTVSYTHLPIPFASFLLQF